MVAWDPDLRRGTVRAGDVPLGGRRKGRVKGLLGGHTGRRVNQQRLEVIRGFLNYVVRTYPWTNPYIKDLHLTIDRWRPGSVAGGWHDRWRACIKPRLHMPARRAWDSQDKEDQQEDGTEDK